MTAEYSPSTDDEYLEVRKDRGISEANENSDNEVYDYGDKNEKTTLQTEDAIEVLNQIPKRAVPNANVPERIVICIDACQQDNSIYELEPGTTFTPLNILKRITEFFLYSKQSINHNSEFALIVLKETEPVWVHQFTKNILEIIIALDSFEGEMCKVPEFDLSLLFNLVHSKVKLPEVCADYKLVPPPNVVRLILMYNRSECIPKLASGLQVYHQLKDHPYFTTDILYSHEEDCSENKCAEIYDALQLLDNGYSYIYEVSKSAMKIHECAAKLLAHPLQRPIQKNASYIFLNDKC